MVNHLNCRDLPLFLQQKGEWIKRVGIIFGCESNGLTNLDLAVCDMISTIPTSCGFPSFNLSHAVTIYAYECSRIRIDPPTVMTLGRHSHRELPDVKSIDSLKMKVKQIFLQMNLSSDERMMGETLQAMGKLNGSDLLILHALTQKIGFFLKSIKNKNGHSPRREDSNPSSND